MDTSQIELSLKYSKVLYVLSRRGSALSAEDHQELEDQFLQMLGSLYGDALPDDPLRVLQLILHGMIQFTNHKPVTLH